MLLDWQLQKMAKPEQMILETAKVFGEFGVLLSQRKGGVLVSSLSEFERWKPRPSCAGSQT